MTMEASPQPSLGIFALSIDETIKWASLDVLPRADNPSDFISLPETRWHGEFQPPTEWPDNLTFQRWLSSQLFSLQAQFPAAFMNRRRIGVSSIGTIHHVPEVNGYGERKLLKSLPRKPWPKSDDCIVHFNDLFASIFPDIEMSSPALSVNNDVTAKALAESALIANTKFPFVYITVSEGVNCGVILQNGPLRTALHPELAHARPALHQKEQQVDIDHSGCRRHKDCFEALASGGRLRKRWHRATEDPVAFIQSDSKDADEAREILSWYVAQACFTITCIIAPRLIVVGGYLASERILAMIRKSYHEINNNTPRYHETEALDRFIRLGVADSSQIDLFGAAHVAYSGRGNFSVVR